MTREPSQGGARRTRMFAMGPPESGVGGPLVPLDLAIPLPAPDEVLVRVCAASVNRADLAPPARWPAASGCDAAGVVAATGSAVTGLAPSDRVMTVGCPGGRGHGTYAEFVAVPAAQCARLARFPDSAAAAAAGLAALAAHQALYALMPEPGETIVIHGAAGGVGSFALQIAARSGARVLANARPEAHPHCLALGADACFDGRGEDLVAAVGRLVPGGRVNAVLDLVGDETQGRTAAVIRHGGRLVTLARPPGRGDLHARRVTAWRVDAQPGNGGLAEVARMLELGELRAPVARVLPLAEAAEAHQLLARGGVRGKLVLEVTPRAGLRGLGP